MRSNLKEMRETKYHAVTGYYYAVTKRKSEHNTYDVMGWPSDKAIPKELSDWLAYLLKYRILESADEELNNGEVLTVRYNLGEFQISRGLSPLFSSYPQYVSLLKVDSGKINIWVDGKLSAMIRNGKVYGKRIWAKSYDRYQYTISRLLATEELDIMAALKLFPGAKHHYIINHM